MRGGRVIPWTTSEYACILNWIDYCHINKLDYRETVVQKLQGQSSREVNIRKIQDRLRFVWGKYGGHSKFSYDDLLTTGVTYYHVSKFPVELTTQMNDERKILGMPLLKIKRTPKDIEHKTDEMPYIMGTPGPQVIESRRMKLSTNCYKELQYVKP
jgi:hypothetical protein